MIFHYMQRRLPADFAHKLKFASQKKLNSDCSYVVQTLYRLLFAQFQLARIFFYQISPNFLPRIFFPFSLKNSHVFRRLSIGILWFFLAVMESYFQDTRKRKRKLDFFFQGKILINDFLTGRTNNIADHASRLFVFRNKLQ